MLAVLEFMKRLILKELKLSLRHGADTTAAAAVFRDRGNPVPFRTWGQTRPALAAIAAGVVWVCALLAAFCRSTDCSARISRTARWICCCSRACRPEAWPRESAGALADHRPAIAADRGATGGDAALARRAYPAFIADPCARARCCSRCSARWPPHDFGRKPRRGADAADHLPLMIPTLIFGASAVTSPHPAAAFTCWPPCCSRHCLWRRSAPGRRCGRQRSKRPPSAAFQTPILNPF